MYSKRSPWKAFDPDLVTALTAVSYTHLNDAAAHRLRAELLERLAAQTANGVARNIYLEAATAERKAIQ